MQILSRFDMLAPHVLECTDPSAGLSYNAVLRLPFQLDARLRLMESLFQLSLEVLDRIQVLGVPRSSRVSSPEFSSQFVLELQSAVLVPHLGFLRHY